MNRDAVLAAFDAQVRRRPRLDSPDGVVEDDGRVVRVVDPGHWGGVVWSRLDAASADAVVAAQVERLAGLGMRWEWKLYSYDEPPDLADRLRAAGFVPEPEEALLVADIAGLDLDVATPAGVALRPVAGPDDAAALVAVHDAVFGGDHAPLGRAVLQGLGRSLAAVVAYDGPQPVSAGRVEFHHGTEFASLWGGGTLPEWRGRGVFRALVAWRARLAAERGFRYLQVDASEESRPILERLGFVALATTTPYVHPGG